MPVSKPGARQRRRRGSINAGDILAGAFEVARKDSLDQLSMPNLAEHLDVGVTSIYWYFRKKEELLNRMTDVLVDNYVAAMPAVDARRRWQDVLHDHFATERQLHLADPLLTDLLLIRTSVATTSREAARQLFSMLETVLARLVAAGFGTQNALQVYTSASIFTRGIILQDRLLRITDSPTLDERQRDIIDWSGLPLLHSQIDSRPLAGTTDEDFEFGLERLVVGFEELLRRERREHKARRGSAGG